MVKVYLGCLTWSMVRDKVHQDQECKGLGSLPPTPFLSKEITVIPVTALSSGLRVLFSTVHCPPLQPPIISSMIPSLARRMNESCSQFSTSQQSSESNWALWIQAQRFEERNLSSISQQFFTDSKSLALAPFQRHALPVRFFFKIIFFVANLPKKQFNYAFESITRTCYQH